MSSHPNPTLILSNSNNTILAVATGEPRGVCEGDGADRAEVADFRG
jgi:hypothetical protein